MSVPTSEIKITPVTEPILHAEGPHWIQAVQKLLYVDTFNTTIHRWNYKTKKVSSYKLENHDSVGVIIPISDEVNQYILCADRTLYRFEWTDSHTSLKYLNLVDQDKPFNQFNDGKADMNGRLWIGTLTRNKDLSVTHRGGSLFTITGKNLEIIEEKITETSISNGLEWSPDNDKFYYIDSVTRTVVGYDYHQNCGSITNKRVVFNLKYHPELDGIPDGMTIDNEGNLWVALFGGHYVLNIDPNTGKLIRKIKLPVSYLTSACFGGPNLDILFVTSSRLHLNEEQMKQEPLAGCVFAIENLKVKGSFINSVIL